MNVNYATVVIPAKQKKVIGVVVPSLEFSGGVQTIVEMLIQQIEISEAYDYLLVSLATSSRDDCSTRIRNPSTFLGAPKIKILEWRGRKIVHVGCALAELEFMRYRPRRILKKILAKCDVIQVVGGFPAWGATVLDCGKPVAVWAATRCQWERRRLLSENNGLITYWRWLMTYALNRLDDRVISKTDCMMVMNPLMLDYSLGRKASGSTSVVYAPPGVDIEWFSPGYARSQANFQLQMPYILSVGRFSDPRKNPELLLEAYSIARNSNSAFPNLVLAGLTAPSAAFWQEVVELGLKECVVFIDKPDSLQLKILYQDALCFALSSDEEGFGMVIVEAMACGVPAVSTRCGGPDGIIKDGVDGFLVNIGDAAALAERISTLCLDMKLNEAMGVQARAHVVADFSEKASGKVFFNVWDKMLKLK